MKVVNRQMSMNVAIRCWNFSLKRRGFWFFADAAAARSLFFLSFQYFKCLAFLSCSIATKYNVSVCTFVSLMIFFCIYVTNFNTIKLVLYHFDVFSRHLTVVLELRLEKTFISQVVLLGEKITSEMHWLRGTTKELITTTILNLALPENLADITPRQVFFTDA